MSEFNVTSHVIVSILAVIFGQVAGHLSKKLVPIVKEEITYKEFFNTLLKDFKIDIVYSIMFLILNNLLAYILGNIYSTYIYIIALVPMMLAFVIDFKYRLIPDETHIIIIVCAIVNLCFSLDKWLSYLLGMIAGGLIFYLLGLLALLIFKKEGMGFGDVKLMASLGLLFGFKGILVIALVSFVFGAVIGVILLIVKRKDADGYIPFGPFIVIGAFILMVVPADTIINIYITFCSWLGDKMYDLIFSIASK